jgi:hypothetical protein
MRKALVLVALIFVFGPAAAQKQNPPANPGPGNNAVNTTNTNNPGAPVAGANSFTESQAKARIESNGFSNVTALKKDDSGIWRGKAMKNGKSTDVSLDFQGNVVSR